MEPAPNYTATTDPLDTQQLTDGRTSEGTLWQDATAVGWRSVRPVTITIDLGEVHSISELRWHAAAGSGEVKWPAAINVFLSSDGRTFLPHGDLVAADPELSTLPADEYRAHALRLAIAATDARYVRLMVDRNGSYVFADEIEVLGPADGHARVIEGCAQVTGKPLAPVEDTLSAFWVARTLRRATLAIDNDERAIGARLALSDLPAAERERLTSELDAATTAARNEVAAGPLSASRLPLSISHERMYSIAAAAERASGSAALSVWEANPWEPLDPLARPGGSGQSQLSTAVMRGERRARAFNLRVSSPAPLAVTLRLALPGFEPSEVRLYRVNWTGNERSRWAAAELELLDGDGESQITLLPGVTQQIWVQAQPLHTAPGKSHGAISISTGASTQQLPLDVMVYKTRMPEALSTRFGGWDYADGSGMHPAVTATNRARLVAYLRSCRVDTPWATRRVLHWNHVGSDGAVANLPDKAALELWLRDWPNASRFRVFVSARDAIGPIAITDPHFDGAVAAWARSWATQIRNLHKAPEQFDLLLVDEPQSDAQAATTLKWARAIRDSGAGFKIWTDPMWRDPNAVPAALLDTADTIAINGAMGEQGVDEYWEWARRLRAQDRNIVEMYAPIGPARLLDPYAYYRLAAWSAYSIGASGVTLWSFSDTRGPASDHEFAARDHDYSPFFIRPDGVRPGKHMEAAVEGLHDIEYLHILARRLAGAVDGSLRAEGEALLDEATQLAVVARNNDPAWSLTRDRNRAEELRLRVGALLDRMD